jgi:hypothetical protein
MPTHAYCEQGMLAAATAAFAGHMELGKNANLL